MVTTYETIDVLQDSLELLRAGWCQGTMAKDCSRIMHVPCTSEEAKFFCLHGAIRRVCHPKLFFAEQVLDKLDALLFEFDTDAFIETKGELEMPTMTWNDAQERTKDDVLAFVGFSINRLKQSLDNKE